MQDVETVIVNFARPMPLLPTPGVAVLPHAVSPVHIGDHGPAGAFDAALDGPGLVAVAMLDRGTPPDGYGRPAVRPAVCIAQIATYSKAEGGAQALLRGICRATIAAELDPAEPDHAEPGTAAGGGQPPSDTTEQHAGNRMVQLQQPQEQLDEIEDAPGLAAVRGRLLLLLQSDPLTSLAVGQRLVHAVEHEELAAAAAVELVGAATVKGNEPRYALLAENDPAQRAALIESELLRLRSLLRIAGAHAPNPDGMPRGCSLN